MSQNKFNQAFNDAAGKYFALKAIDSTSPLVLLNARVEMMRHIPSQVENALCEVAKRHFPLKNLEYNTEDDVMLSGWRRVIAELKTHLLVCDVEETAIDLYKALQEANRTLGFETEPFEACAPLIGPAITAANQKGIDLLNKLMNKGGAA